jgi:hypothetical protein
LESPKRPHDAECAVWCQPALTSFLLSVTSLGNTREGPTACKRNDMAWENAVHSEYQDDVAACLAEQRENEPEIPERTKSGCAALFSGKGRNVFPIVVPPLRNRREDIPLLVRHFLRIYSERMNKRIEWIPTEVMEAMTAHCWPGNIRELQNFIERSVILTDGRTLTPPLAGLRETIEIHPPIPTTLEEVERHHIRKILEQAHWIVGGPSGAALRLGLKRSTLYARMQKLGIFRASQITENTI